MAIGERISAIIPSLREGRRLLESIRAARSALGSCEVIVVAFGESANIRDAARLEGVLWVESTKANRGHQLQLGAQHATGDLFIFVHADSRLPVAAAQLVRSAMSVSGVAGGAFRLQFDLGHPVLSMLSWLSRLGLTASFLGDQCLFCSRRAYLDAGGFHPEPLFEDVGFARRLSGVGALVRLAASVTTSARRFRSHGHVRQLVWNALLFAAFHLGASPRRLHELYEPGRRSGTHSRVQHRRGAGRRVDRRVVRVGSRRGALQ